MKKQIIIILLVLVAMSNIFAQAPQSFKYQAVVRDISGTVLSNQNVGFQISILQGSETGSSVYTETFTTTTNSYGLVNLNIGEGTIVNGNFTTIDWGTNTYFVKVELDENGGTNYNLLGTSKLNSVPYALHSKTAENASNVFSGDYNDLSNTPNIPTSVSQLSNDLGFITSPNDADSDIHNELQVLNFSNDTLYLSDGGQVYMGAYSNLWATHGDDIYNTNLRNVGVGLEDPTGKLVVQGDSAVSDTLPLFEVKNKDGITVFAVYDGGVRVYVNDDPAKANNEKSGFAVGGYRLDKSITNEYMRVTPDSVRVYIKEENTNKNSNKKGGFAVGGYRLDKTTPEEYMNIYSADTAYTINPSEPRMLWYPLKEAFSTGRVIIESSDSVGLNSWATGFESKSIGNYSQALGYHARAKGNNSTAIGDSANAIGNNSYALGNNSLVVGANSYAFGSNSEAIGDNSFVLGSDGEDMSNNPIAGTKATGEYSYAFGMGSLSSGKGAFSIGTMCTTSGTYSFSSGYNSTASGPSSTAMGIYTIASGNYSTANGYYTEASGKYSTAFGHQTHAYEFASLATGSYTKAYGAYSTSMGYFTKASGRHSVAMGTMTVSQPATCLTIGRYNVISGDSISWIASDPVFIIGNGSSTSNSHNAMTVLKNGTTNLYPVNTTKGLYINHDMDASGSTYGIQVDLDNNYTGSSYNYGIYSSATNNNGSYSTYGVRGYAGGTSTGTKYGVYGSTSGSGTRYAVYASGDLAYTGSLVSVSDRKFKENVSDLNNVLPDLMKIDIRTFTFKETSEFKNMGFPKGTQFGVIAQELEKVFPELVVNGTHPGTLENDDKEESSEITYKGVNYMELVPIAIKAIQEQQEIIDNQSKEMEQIKSENELLKARLDKIEKLLSK